MATRKNLRGRRSTPIRQRRRARQTGRGLKRENCRDRERKKGMASVPAVTRSGMQENILLDRDAWKFLAERD